MRERVTQGTGSLTLHPTAHSSPARPLHHLPKQEVRTDWVSNCNFSLEGQRTQTGAACGFQMFHEHRSLSLNQILREPNLQNRKNRSCPRQKLQVRTPPIPPLPRLLRHFLRGLCSRNVGEKLFLRTQKYTAPAFYASECSSTKSCKIKQKPANKQKLYGRKTQPFTPYYAKRLWLCLFMLSRIIIISFHKKSSACSHRTTFELPIIVHMQLIFTYKNETASQGNFYSIQTITH